MRQYLWVVVALLGAAIAGAAAMRGWTKEHEAQDRILLLQHNVKHTDSVFRVDTLYFDRKLKVEVALHDTVVKHLTDTILVTRYIAAAESTIAACQEVVKTCAQRVAERDSLIKIYKSLKPSRFTIGIQATCGLGVASKVDCVGGLGASFRLF